MSRSKQFSQWRPKYQAILDEKSDLARARQIIRYEDEENTGATPMHRFSRYGMSGYATDEGDLPDEDAGIAGEGFDYSDPNVMYAEPYRAKPWERYATQNEELFHLDVLQGFPEQQRDYGTYKEEYMDTVFPSVSRRDYSKPYRQRLKALRPSRQSNFPGRMAGRRPARRPSRYGGWRTY